MSALYFFAALTTLNTTAVVILGGFTSSKNIIIIHQRFLGSAERKFYNETLPLVLGP